MNISLSVLAQDKQFGKNVRRVRTDFDAFLDEFGRVILIDPIHDTILVGLVDVKPERYFEIIPNRDGFFQTMGGVDPAKAGRPLKEVIFAIIARSVEACPFSNPDREQFMQLIAKWQHRL